MSTQDFPLRFETPAGPVELTLQAEESVVHASAIVEPAMELADTLLSAAGDFMGSNGLRVSCRLGCSACCNQLVMVSPLEAFVIAKAFKKLDETQRAGVTERLTAAETRLEETGLATRIDALTAGATDKTVAFDYFAEGLACPMLEHGGCAIYADRPAQCRQLLVVSDARKCDAPDQSEVQRVPLLMDMQRALRSVSAAMFPDQPVQMPLTRALKWVEDNDDLWEVGAKGINLMKGLLQAAAKQEQRRA